MSLKIDEYLGYSGITSATAAQGMGVAEKTGSNFKQESDSYISSVGSSDDVLPSENYNDILKIMQSAKSEGNGTATSSETSGEAGTSGETGAAGGTGASGGAGGDSGSDEETTTKIVTVNGVTYLETTTVSDGVTSVQRTVIGK